MGNINNFNYNNLNLRLSNSDYWDMFLAADGNGSGDCTPLLNGSCSVVWYDFNQPSIYIGNDTTSIYSLRTWDNAVNDGYDFETFGLTGIDNGRVVFQKGNDPTNPELVSALTGSTLVIPSGDTRLNLHAVTGTTGVFNYSYETLGSYGNSLGKYVTLKGGFYQGFYKIDGSSYEVLPTRVPQSWSTEFWLRKENLLTNGTTLNDTYPNNKGLFFYMGTRAENKFWTQFSGVSSGCASACTVDVGCTDIPSPWCTVPKENEVNIVGDYGFAIPLAPPQVEIDLVTNGFLIYGRAYDGRPDKLIEPEGTFIFPTTASTESSGSTCHRCRVCNRNHDGLGTQTVCSYDGNGIAVINTAKVQTNFTNPFLIYGRAAKQTGSNCSCRRCKGPQDGLGNETVCSFSGMTSPQEEVDYKLDILDNALGFRITDAGAIGYRLLTITGQCIDNNGVSSYVSGVTVEESYSVDGVIKDDEWAYVVVKFITNELDECELSYVKPRTGKLMFYVNGYLKHTVYNFDEFIGRRLQEYKTKQIGVPFNFSVGGGTQGLIESQTFDGIDPDDRGLPIETNFAGTFIGSISQFKFNICNLDICEIRENYKNGVNRYNLPPTPFFIIQETNPFITQEGGFKITLE